jgi:membrane-associated protease RseP (regulator of RpoE activity)
VRRTWLLAVALLVAGAGVLAWWLRSSDAVAPPAAPGAPADVGAPAATTPEGAHSAGPMGATQSTPAPVTLPFSPAEPPVAGATQVANGATAEQRQENKLTRGLKARPEGGILVEAVPPGSVAGQLRLQVGDAIMTVNGEPVGSPEEFARIYREQGLPRQLTIIRDGREMHRH